MMLRIRCCCSRSQSGKKPTSPADFHEVLTSRASRLYFLKAQGLAKRTVPPINLHTAKFRTKSLAVRLYKDLHRCRSRYSEAPFQPVSLLSHVEGRCENLFFLTLEGTLELESGAHSPQTRFFCSSSLRQSFHRCSAAQKRCSPMVVPCLALKIS